MWVRGLKLGKENSWYHARQVAPHVGAWIETSYQSPYRFVLRSHPMWVRGLKPLYLQEYNKHRMSHPMWVRGLKRLVLFVLVIYVGRTPCGCVD